MLLTLGMRLSSTKSKMYLRKSYTPACMPWVTAWLAQLACWLVLRSAMVFTWLCISWVGVLMMLTICYLTLAIGYYSITTPSQLLFLFYLNPQVTHSILDQSSHRHAI